MMRKLPLQTGYTLVEMLIAVLISTLLMLGISTAYSSITGLVNTGKNLENAQEVLRYCSEVFTRSLKQTSENVTLTSTVLSINQEANSIACDGSKPMGNYTEVYVVNANNLTCDIGSGPKNILTGVKSITFELSTVSASEKLISIIVEPQALHGESSGIGANKPVQIDIALSELILINALGS